MQNFTTAQQVIDAFESSFQDKHIIPEELEQIWLNKAIGRYSVEIEKLNFNEDAQKFDCVLDMYTIDTLGQFMKKFYQERELSKINKRISIVGKDLSIDGAGHTKTAVKNELDYISGELANMLDNQKPSAYV